MRGNSTILNLGYVPMNSLTERHSAILGITVTKTMENIKATCDLQFAASCTASAQNQLKNVDGFIPNQLVWKKDAHFPNVCDDLLPALENKKTSEIIAKNLNALHQARKYYIKS